MTPEPSAASTPPPPAGRVGPLEPAHLQACLALDERCLGGLWNDEQWQRELADPARPGVGLWQGPELLAMACAWLVVDELHITLVAVDPHWRRQGLGRRVMDQLLATGHRRGAGRATLEVASGNTPARGLYGSLGFTEAGVRRGYYRNGDDALIQWAKLSDQTGFG